MKADMSLFSRILVACRSRPDIDFKAILCYYQFSVLPPSLFSPDGSMHHILAKSKLMGILEALPNNKEYISSLLHTEQNVQATSKVAVVDGMAQLHCIVKAIVTHIMQRIVPLFLQSDG